MTSFTLKQRRSDQEKISSGDYFDGVSRYFDHITEMTIVKIMAGDCYVSEYPGEMLVTILGSCISACIRDPELGIGGMNHFLLPSTTFDDATSSLRFGSYAMEQLINTLLSRGANKKRLEVKIFGGGHVINSSMDIGERNIRFVQEYLANENLSIASQDVGGDYPRRIHYCPENGKVKLRRLRRDEDRIIVSKEESYLSSVNTKPVEGDVELFI